LSKTNQLIKKFQNEVKSIKPTPESIQKIQKLNELNNELYFIDVEKLRLMMENIESSVYSFKENQKVKFDEYLNEEKLLQKEIEAYDKKFDIWLNQKNNGFKSERSHSTTNLKDFIENNGSELLPEVITFDVIIK
jgi:hypothetical protein